MLVSSSEIQISSILVKAYLGVKAGINVECVSSSQIVPSSPC